MRIRRSISVGAVVLALIALVVLTGCAAASEKQAAAGHSPIPAGKSCADCHAKDKTHLPPYVGACDRCHGLTSWRTVTYAHADDTFNQAAHGVIGCVRCHTEGTPPPSPQCNSCHEAPHGGWTACVKCHVPLTWLMRRPTPAGHVSLLGGHSNLTCIECHSQPQEPAKPRTCTNCHGTKHGGLTDCGRCHDPSRGWTPNFDHNTVFRLSGVHATLVCTKCHTAGRFFGMSPKCVSCHGVHHGGLTACASCHTTAGFKPSTFRHSSRFALSPGPHARLACTRCHPSRQFAKVRGRTCAGCHGPQHGGLTTCTPCHTKTGAISGTMRHDVFFPLVGIHKTLACSKCHGTPFRPAPGKNCVDCHGVMHGGQTVCDACHTTTSFSPIKAITHPAPIRLGAQHSSRPCQLCHPTLVFNAPTKPCVDCHLADVPHVGPTDCLRCHWPTTWADTHFTHPPVPVHDVTNFPCLDGCHIGDFTTYTCNRCH